MTPSMPSPLSVIPAKAGTPLFLPRDAEGSGTPAFAGATKVVQK